MRIKGEAVERLKAGPLLQSFFVCWLRQLCHCVVPHLQFFWNHGKSMFVTGPVSILHKSIAGRYPPVKVADRQIYKDF